jgi:hypothetical protein
VVQALEGTTTTTHNNNNNNNNTTATVTTLSGAVEDTAQTTQSVHEAEKKAQKRNDKNN